MRCLWWPLLLVACSTPTPLDAIKASSPDVNPEMGHFLVYADSHVDPCFGNWDRAEQTCFTKDNDGLPDYHMDAPVRLLKSAVKALRQRKNKPDFILFLGDFASHFFHAGPSGSQDPDDIRLGLLTVFQKHVSIFRKEWADGCRQCAHPLMVMGNNDFFPNYNASIVDDSVVSERFLYQTSQVFQKNMLDDQDAITTFRKGGYFALGPTATESNVTFLVLNTVLYSTQNPNVNLSVDDPSGGFKWLKDELEFASSSGGFVYIVGHIAPSTDHWDGYPYWLWFKKYVRRYEEITTKYKDIIKGQFFGHEHSDLFRLSKTGVMMVHSSISPVYGNNPVIREYSYNRYDGTIADFREWYIDLNRTERTGELKWELLFKSVTKEFDLQSLSVDSMLGLKTRFCENDDLFQKYVSLSVARSLLSPAGTVCHGRCKCLKLCNFLYSDIRTEECNGHCMEDSDWVCSGSQPTLFNE